MEVFRVGSGAFKRWFCEVRRNVFTQLCTYSWLKESGMVMGPALSRSAAARWTLLHPSQVANLARIERIALLPENLNLQRLLKADQGRCRVWKAATLWIRRETYSLEMCKWIYLLPPTCISHCWVQWFRSLQNLRLTWHACNTYIM